MKKKAIIITALILIVFIFFTIYLLLKPANVQTLNNRNIDVGFQTAVNNNLIDPVNIPFTDSENEITGIYYDGLRLYIEVKSDEFIPSKAVIIDSSENERASNHMFRYDENTTVLIWDNFIEQNNTILQLTASTGDIISSPILQLNSEAVIYLEAERYFEEIFLHTMILGRTSTLLNMDIYTTLEINKFQMEFNNEVVSEVFQSKNDTNYVNSI